MHCFPAIENGVLGKTAKDDHACSLFRPMYPNGSATSSQSGSIEASDDHRRNLERIKQKSYDQGVEAGRADACHMARQELNPSLSQFKAEIEDLNDSYARLTCTYGDRIVLLALAIAEKILGPQTGLASDRLKPLSSEFHRFLKQRYQLSINLNDDDLQSLSNLMACEDPHWNENEALDIKTKTNAEPGSVRALPPTSLESDSHDIALKMDALTEHLEPLMDLSGPRGDASTK